MEETVLLVDDEEDIREVLRFFLSEIGYSVLTAASGKKALEIVCSDHPPVVLCDIKMPEMNGIELLRKIKSESPDTEVIMITGHGDMALAVQCLQLDATDFITKPIEENVLEFALKRATERYDMRFRLREYTEKLEQLVEEKSRQLIDAERMAAIGETVAGLSHSIKNIAGGLKGGLFVLEKGLELDNREYLQQGWQLVRRNVDNIRNLSMDLLNYGKVGAAHFRRVDPNLPIREVFRLMTPRAEEQKIRLEMTLDQGLAPIVLDPDGIERCLLNLVTNALDACADYESQDGAHVVHIQSNKRATAGVVYRVLDTGPGIDDGVREQLFQNFFSTKGMRGTGIGLMMTRKIVELHGGDIRIESETGKGSCFIVRLPAEPPSMPSNSSPTP
ncbi:Adenylate cyclase (EC [Olavius algarvensis associated proteobacterium Delta 3]|nr:Adenylate cyclase (EC [Olavius algarvensis associated proteobacterium Delta 3]CAB5102674.1 Adenylate cyclase (EC [Olavius algarvensis associated proteobacterium Delta 3]